MVKRRERRDGGCVRSIFRGMYMLEARNAADRSSQFALRFQRQLRRQQRVSITSPKNCKRDAGMRKSEN